jgi:hypothetical protein
MRLYHCYLLFYTCFGLLAPAWSEQLPKTESESLAGQRVTLPDSLKGRSALVIVGFSKSSQTAIKEWDTRARKELGDAFDIYQVAVLEDAPRFVRGMITHAIKESVPAALQGHFLVVVKGEAELKKASAFSEADDAYVLLVDGAGEIRWRTHGAVNEAALKALREQVRKNTT